jgi:hypothetical protein
MIILGFGLREGLLWKTRSASIFCISCGVMAQKQSDMLKNKINQKRVFGNCTPKAGSPSRTKMTKLILQTE